MSGAHHSGSFAQTDLTARGERVWERSETFQINAVRRNNHFSRRKVCMKVAFQNIHKRAGNGGESFAPAQICESTMPERTEKSGWLHVDFEDHGQLTQQAKDARLRKPGIQQIG